jgi:hypothetical protein
MRSVVLHSKCLTPAIWINELSDNQRVFGDTVGLSHCKRITLHSLDRTPHVNDLHARLKELIGVIRQMERYTRKRSIVGLIDVDALHWTTKLTAQCGVARWLSSDGVVKDVDASSTSTPINQCSFLRRR